MLVKNPGLKPGYNKITAMDDLPWDDPKNPLMDFGFLILEAKQTYKLENDFEKAILIMQGEVTLKWNDKLVHRIRNSIFDDNPSALLVPKSVTVEISAGEQGVELCLIQTIGGNNFEPKYYSPEECITEQFGKGTLRETSTRDVRTIFDANNKPESKLVLGEVINYPGKWSSYPPHGHNQPEIYSYRFLPEQGFGFGMTGENEVNVVKNGDTTLILNGAPHSQTSAPGYAMYYIWAIRHIDGDPYGPEDPRKFLPEHTWVMNPENNAIIWPPEE